MHCQYLCRATQQHPIQSSSPALSIKIQTICISVHMYKHDWKLWLRPKNLSKAANSLTSDSSLIHQSQSIVPHCTSTVHQYQQWYCPQHLQEDIYCTKKALAVVESFKKQQCIHLNAMQERHSVMHHKDLNSQDQALTSDPKLYTMLYMAGS